MGPKILAALRFLERGGREAVITRDTQLARAIRGDGGTHVVAEP
jgi:carbamate kinase